MKHGQKTKKLGRVGKQRLALMRSLAEALVKNERIKTTEARAKALRPYIEKLITKGRNDTVAVRRQLVSQLGGRKEIVTKIVDDIAPRYSERSGGYTRVLKLPPRDRDAARMAIIEFVETE